MTESASITVRVNRPGIEGDTVWFTWEDDSELPPPSDGGLFYCFEGLDLSVFSETLWLEIFLALRLRTWSLLDRPVQVLLPASIPAAVANFWLTYYTASNVEVSPLSAAESYDPVPGRYQAPVQQYEAAVLFGGGLDSLSAACLLGELHQRQRILLIQMVNPHKPGAQPRQRMRERQQSLSLSPAATLGFSTQRIFANLNAIALAEGTGPYQPHVEQYTVAALPVLLHHQIPYSTFGYAWLEYIWRQEGQDQWVARYPRSRPEILGAQSRHLRRTSGFAHAYLNLGLVSSTAIAFRVLSHHYPEAMPATLSCQSSSGRWCNHCRRCARQGLMRLEEQFVDESFNLDRLFARSQFVLQLIEHAKTAAAPSPGENAAWDLATGSSINFPLLTTALNRIDLAWSRRHLGVEAMTNLTMLKALYGAQEYPVHDFVPLQSFACFPETVGSMLHHSVSPLAQIRDLRNEPLQMGAGPAHDPYWRPFHHLLLELDANSPAPA